MTFDELWENLKNESEESMAFFQGAETMSYHQTIYNLLRQAGMTEAGALGVLGNWECESNCEPNRVQGDFSPNRTLSKEYVAKIMNGTISRDQFAHDQKGYSFRSGLISVVNMSYTIFGKLMVEGLTTFRCSLSSQSKSLKEILFPTGDCFAPQAISMKQQKRCA